jgi:hypothetical protein
MSSRLHELDEVELLDLDISTVLVELIDDVFTFLGLQELEGRFGALLVGEFYDKEESEDGDCGRNHTFNDKNPK